MSGQVVKTKAIGCLKSGSKVLCKLVSLKTDLLLSKAYKLHKTSLSWGLCYSGLWPEQVSMRSGT